MSKKKAKNDFDIKIVDAPEISDAFESEVEEGEEIEETEEIVAIDVLEEVKEEQPTDETKSFEELQRILQEIESTTSNKERAYLIDKLIDYPEYEETVSVLKNIAVNDKYPLCRAKAVSFLSDFMRDIEIKDLVIRKLQDSSQTVRLWAVWSLRALVDEEDVQEVLLRQLRHYEKSRRIKLWLIRVLSDKINNPRVIDVFLQSLKGRPNKEMRKLILYYILQIPENSDVSYFLSTYVHKENDKEIRLEIVKKLLEMDNSDTRYALQKLKRNERNQEIVSLLS